MEKYPITKKGYEKLKLELNHLKNVERPQIIERIAAARELGDLKENADYHASKDKQGIIEATIADLENKFARAQVIDAISQSGDIVRFSATVKLEDIDNEKTVSYTIVSEYEADIDSGLISNTSPVAKALIGKEIGDDVEIRTPGGVINYEILEVKFN